LAELRRLAVLDTRSNRTTIALSGMPGCPIARLRRCRTGVTI
jgi:hypothetical protein